MTKAKLEQFERLVATAPVHHIRDAIEKLVCIHHRELRDAPIVVWPTATEYLAFVPTWGAGPNGYTDPSGGQAATENLRGSGPTADDAIRDLAVLWARLHVQTDQWRAEVFGDAVMVVER